MAKLRGVRVHVFEEGYIRPDWVTLEEDGVNGRSLLPRDPAWYVQAARRLPPLPERPSVTASFGRRMRDALHYYLRLFFGFPAYPFFRNHRRGSLTAEAVLWVGKLARKQRDEARAAETWSALKDTRYFLFPLQLSTDYQIREHSPFQDMVEALDYVLYSFSRRAPRDVKLVIKEHPLDPGYASWRRLVRRRARSFGLEGRLIHIAGGDLTMLTAASRGMITVNSTSATLALNAGVPTIVLGTAIYNVPGLTHQGRLDSFWAQPTPPNTQLWDSFRRVLHDRCLVYGGFASESAVTQLVESAFERLMHAGNRAAAADLREFSVVH
jgi:capsular polysaccharide export protein